MTEQDKNQLDEKESGEQEPAAELTPEPGQGEAAVAKNKAAKKPPKKKKPGKKESGKKKSSKKKSGEKKSGKKKSGEKKSGKKKARKKEAKSRVQVKPKSLPLRVAQSGALVATVKGKDAELLWLTTNSTIARVIGAGVRGIVLGVSPGNATVTVVIQGEGDKATAEVRVT